MPIFILRLQAKMHEAQHRGAILDCWRPNFNFQLLVWRPVVLSTRSRTLISANTRYIFRVKFIIFRHLYKGLPELTPTGL